MKKLLSDVLILVVSTALAVGCASAPCQAYAEDSVQENVFGDVVFSDITFKDIPEVLLNNNRFAYNYGYVLNEDQTKTYRFDANNAQAYEVFKNLIAPSENPVEIELASPVTVYDLTTPFQSSFTEDDLENYCEVLFGACKYGIDAAFFDIPELFWIDPSNVHFQAEGKYIQNVSGTYNIRLDKITITPHAFKEFSTMDDLNVYRSKLENAVNDFRPSGDTRYEKLKEIHDKIINFTYYDANARFSSSAIGSLVEPGVVCEGYSEGFKLICDRIDIPCVCVFGNYDASENVGHMWNYVQMEDGKWYLVDVTWDDLDGKYDQEVMYQYFLRGSDSMSANHTPMNYGTTAFEYPTLSKEDFDPTVPIVTTSTSTTTTTVTTTTVTSETFSGSTQTVTFTDQVSTTSHTQTGTSTTGTTPTGSTSTSTGTSTDVTNVTTSSSATTSTETSTETGTGTVSTDETTTTVSDVSTSETSTVTETSTSSTDMTESSTSTTVTATDTETTSSTDETTATSSTVSSTDTSSTDTSSSTTATDPYDPFAVVYDKGDVNRDGIIDISDLVTCINAAIGRDVGDAECDLTGNGIIDSFDVICMRRIYINAGI